MIRKWHLKAVVQKVLSIHPNPEKANYWFQKNVTKGVFLSDEHLGYKVGHAKDHINYFKKYGSRSEESKIVELGTGWYPIIPILFHLTKSGRVISIDNQKWLTKDGILTTIKRLKEWKDSGRLDNEFGKVDEERWQRLESMIDEEDRISINDIKEEIELKTIIADARRTGMEDESIDFICSNNTFEHIYPGLLEEILLEFQRLLKRGGTMSHFIDMTDHFAHFDKSITTYNFLKYSKWIWKAIDNSIQPQNRLRYKDYLKMYDELRIGIIEEEIWPSDVESLRRVKVHKEYEGYTESELSIKHAYIISQK